MNNITSAMMDFMSMDELSKGSSFVHARHPIAKLLTTIVYIAVVISFDILDLSALVPMVLIPIVIFGLSGIEVKVCFFKIRIILPFILAVGIWNPILNRTPVINIGLLVITEGMVSLLTLILKSLLALMMSFLMVATTGIDGICVALRRIRIPGIFVSLILLTYRYISVLLKEAEILWTAYSLRAPGQRGVRIDAWGSYLGQLLLRSMDRSNELYASMRLRGFNGEFAYADTRKIDAFDVLFTLVIIALSLIFRLVNVSDLIGNLFI